MVQLTTDSTITLKQCLSFDPGDMAEKSEIPWNIKVAHVHVNGHDCIAGSFSL